MNPIFKGHLVPAADEEMGISSPEDDLPQTVPKGPHPKVDVFEVARWVWIDGPLCQKQFYF